MNSFQGVVRASTKARKNRSVAYKVFDVSSRKPNLFYDYTGYVSLEKEARVIQQKLARQLIKLKEAD